MTSIFVPEPAAPREAPLPLLWRSWPLVDEWRTAAVLIVLIAAGGCGIGWQTSNPALGALATCMLLLATWRFWIPTTFELNAKGVSMKVRRWRRVPWQAIASYQPSGNGALLRLEPQGTMLAPLRTVFVPWNNNRQRVSELLDYYAGAGAAGKGDSALKQATG